MSYHILKTWLLANLLHPLLLCIWFDAAGTIGSDGLSELAQGFVWVFLPSLIFSVPALLFCQGAMYILQKLVKNSALLFAGWFFTAPLAVLLNYALPFLYLRMSSHIIEEITYVIPAVLSAAFAVVLQHRQFFTAMAGKCAYPQ